MTLKLEYKINRFWSWELCVLFGMHALNRNALYRLLLMHFQPYFSHTLMITWVGGKLFPIPHQFLLCLNMRKFYRQGFGSGFQLIALFRHSTSTSSTTMGNFPPNALITAVLSNFQVIWCWIEGDGGLLAWRAVARVFAIVAILPCRWCSTYGLWHSSRGRCRSLGSFTVKCFLLARGLREKKYLQYRNLKSTDRSQKHEIERRKSK